MRAPAGVRGVLLDVDGTLLEKDRPIPGAARAVDALRARGIPFRLTTNTTRRPRSATAAVLRAAGIIVEPEEIVVPATLARRLILESGRRRAALLVPPAAREDFEGVTEDERSPEWVVLGDLGRDFTFDRLNAAFSWLRSGAGFLALHKNRYWSAAAGGTVLDAGAFVAALEYASGVAAEVVGKPSRAFFELAAREIGLATSEVLVVGDDAEADVAGGAAAGCRTALVRTGKASEEAGAGAAARPDLVLESVAALVD